MKTKLYRTITLVLAIVMLLGVTPAFAAEDGTENRPIWLRGLPLEDWENHNYKLIPYDANVAIDPNQYIPFSDFWYYGNRTSASSKTDYWELEDGICYFKDNGDAALNKRGISFKNYNISDEIPAYFDGNTHLKTVISETMFAVSGFFTVAPALETVISLESAIWGDWTTNLKAGYLLYPACPKNVTIIGGLVKGEMCIGSSNNYAARRIFTDRKEFIEAVKPILASAHLNERAWNLIPDDFGGKVHIDPLKYEQVSDWAKNEFLKAMEVGIHPQTAYNKTSFSKMDRSVPACKSQAATFIVNAYEAICKANGVSTNYPSNIPEKFGPNKSTLAINKGATLGIFKGDGTTWRYNGKTYDRFGNSDKLTREQMAAMLTRLAKACGKTLPAGTMPFTDAMSDWAKPEVSACYGAGLIKGTSATTFGALDNITYEQAVVLCYRAYVYLTTH